MHTTQKGALEEAGVGLLEREGKFLMSAPTARLRVRELVDAGNCVLISSRRLVAWKGKEKG